MRRLAHRDQELRRELTEVDGFQALIETSNDDNLLRTWVVTETEEVGRRRAPADVFEPPPGYRRAEHLSRLDL